MELIQFFKFLIRWSGLIIITSILAGLTGFLAAQRQTPVYQASTTLLVTAVRPEREAPRSDDYEAGERLARTYIELLDKRPVLEQVVTDLELPYSASQLDLQLNIDLVPETNLLVITAEDSSPQRAADIANRIVTVFNEQEASLLANPYAIGRQGLHVVEIAVAPNQPIRPDLVRTLLMALLAGIMLSVGLAFLIEYMDTSIHSREDMAQLTDLPTLALIGRLRGRKPVDRLVPLKKPFSDAAEAYRIIRSEIEFAGQSGAIRSLMVTSSRSGEGKSMTAANLAIALAQTGMRVVLVDANLRRPVLHKLFQKSNTTGFSTAMQHPEQPRLYEYTQSSDVEDLRLLPAGPLLSNPARLFEPAHIQRLLDALVPHADLVIFDSPALLDVIDSTLLLRSVDASILVVQMGSTPATVLLQAQAYLERSGNRALGVVLNRAPLAVRLRRAAYRKFPSQPEPGKAQLSEGTQSKPNRKSAGLVGE
jgi:capsular exopolysaccharide synthesis family protein